MKKTLLMALMALATIGAKAQTIHQDSVSDMVFVEITPVLNRDYDADSVVTLWMGPVADHHTWLICYWELRNRNGKVMDRGNYSLQGDSYESGWTDKWLFNQLAAAKKKEIE